MPREVIEARKPDEARLLPAEEKLIKATGWYRCDLRYGMPGGNGEQVLHVVATTDRDQQHRVLDDTFHNEGWSWNGQVPEGLPGILQVNDSLQLLLDCPGLAKDAEGRPRKLLVRSGVGAWSGESAPPELVKSAVSLANEASRRLGCGAKPLNPPTSKVYREPQPVPRTKQRLSPAIGRLTRICPHGRGSRSVVPGPRTPYGAISTGAQSPAIRK